MNNKFEVGDKVRIVKYGALMWSNDEMKESENWKLMGKDSDDVYWYDWQPSRVEKEAVVDGVSRNEKDYSLLFKKEGHIAWFNEEQLELVENN